MEDLLASAEALAHLGSFAIDLTTLRATWSDELCRLHALDPAQAPVSLEAVLGRIHPGDLDDIRVMLDGVLEHPEDVPAEGLSGEYRALHPDGTVLALRFLGRIARDDRGRPALWLGTVQDITELRLSERDLHVHYAVSQAVRSWEGFDEGVVGLLRRLATALEFPLAALGVWDDSRARIVARATWSAPDVDAAGFEATARGLALRVGEGMFGWAWEAGEPVATGDLPAHPRANAAAGGVTPGLRSALAFPAMGSDGPVAVLCFLSPERRNPSRRLAETLDRAGGELGRFLERNRGHLVGRRLSDREIEVLAMAAEGGSGPEIAERLFLSPSTVKTHFEHIYEKLGVGDRAAAVAHALRTGLIR